MNYFLLSFCFRLPQVLFCPLNPPHFLTKTLRIKELVIRATRKHTLKNTLKWIFAVAICSQSYLLEKVYLKCLTKFSNGTRVSIGRLDSNFNVWRLFQEQFQEITNSEMLFIISSGTFPLTKLSYDPHFKYWIIYTPENHVPSRWQTVITITFTSVLDAKFVAPLSFILYSLTRDSFRRRAF